MRKVKKKSKSLFDSNQPQLQIRHPDEYERCVNFMHDHPFCMVFTFLRYDDRYFVVRSSLQESDWNANSRRFVENLILQITEYPSIEYIVSSLNVLDRALDLISAEVFSESETSEVPKTVVDNCKLCVAYLIEQARLNNLFANHCNYLEIVSKQASDRLVHIQATAYTVMIPISPQQLS